MTETHIARICEEWTMALTPPPDGEPWFLDWLLRSPKHVSGHLTRGYWAYKAVLDVYRPDEIETAMEYFGGIGAQALMIQEMFKPPSHRINEFSPEAVAHIRDLRDRQIPGLPEIAVQVRQADSYNPDSFFPADLVGFDCGDLTVWKTREGEAHRELLDRVFDSEPKAVALTDIAAPYLHLHRERYETLLGAGTCDTYEGYMQAFMRRLQNLYGYVATAGYVDRWSSVVTLVPQGAAPMGTLQPTPASPVGLELL